MINIYKYPIGFPSSILNNNNEYLPAFPLERLVVIKDNPLDISFSNNIIPFKFRYFVNPNYNSNYSILLSFTMTPPIDSKVRLKNELFDITFIAKLNPNTNEFFTNIINALQNTVSSVKSLALEIDGNQVLNNNYIVTIEGASQNQIRIEAKNPGTVYALDLTALNDSLIGSGIIVSQVNNTADLFAWQLLYPNIKFYSDIYVAKGAIGEVINKRNSILTDSIAFNAPLTEEFDISIQSSLDTYLGFALPKNPYDSNITFEDLDSKGEFPIVRPYYISYGIKRQYRNQQDYKKQPIGVSKILFVSKGGTLDMLSEYNYNQYILDTQTFNQTKFLTNCPISKQITRNSIEYLQIYKKYNTITNDNLSIEVKYIFNDNTNTTTIFPISSNNQIIKGVQSIEVSPKALQIDIIESQFNKIVIRYEVRLTWLYQGITASSDTRIFDIKVQDCKEDTINIIFLNNYGVWDSVEFNNNIQYTIERNTDSFTRPIGISRPKFGFNSKSDMVTIDYNIETNKQITLYTDIISNEQYSWLQEVLNSNAIFIWDTLENSYKHILISDFEYSFDSNNNASYLAITYKSTTNNNNLTI